MQTFLPLPSMTRSAKALDNQRLGKQRVEAFQILNALNGLTKGWVNHPATRMWRGYEEALNFYGRIICEEWIRRGFKDTMSQRFVLKPEPLIMSERFVLTSDPVIFPPWFGDPEFHRSHQSNLVRKNPVYYGSKFPDVPDDLPYVWPDLEKLNSVPQSKNSSFSTSYYYM